VIAGEDGGQGAQHLIGDVQRFGLLSAAAVVDRYTEIINRVTRDASFRLEPLPADERGTGWMVDSAARLAEAYLSLVDTTARLIGTRAKPDAAVPEMESSSCLRLGRDSARRFHCGCTTRRRPRRPPSTST
jgi:hypothetical protein